MQTSSRLGGKCQALETELERVKELLEDSRETGLGLEGQLGEAKRACAALEASKSELMVGVARLEQELTATKEELSQQISEKEEQMEKAEVLLLKTLCLP